MRNWPEHSSHGQSKPIRKYFACSKFSILKRKKKKSHAGQFPLPQYFLILSQIDKLLLGFFCCILRKWEQKYADCTRKWVPMRGIFFSIFQVNVFLMVKWHFTKNLNSWLASVWNKTANPNITDMNPDAGFYSIQNTWVWHHQIFKRPYIITKLDSTFYCKKKLFLCSLKKNWFFSCLLWMLQCFYAYSSWLLWPWSPSCSAADLLNHRVHSQPLARE